MFRFIHSADWQLGARLAGFGANSERLRAQRLTTLRTALNLARERAADAFLVAGDLFEDNLVDDSLVDETLRLFGEFPDLPICLLPGNHDPANGPASIWSRCQFRDDALPPNVVVFREPGAHPLGPVALLVSPLRQKVSSTDPSLCLRDLARQQPADRVKIGLTHGALAIPGKHQPNDFPIDPRAATRAGLNYLGIGHWHNWQTYDDDRLVMPGTPEPDAFGQDHAGHVAYVEIDGPAAAPRVEKVRVGALRWTHWDCDFGNFEAHRAALQLHVSGWGDAAPANVCRVCFHGAAAGEDRAAALASLHELFGAAFHFEVDDSALRATLSDGEFAALERDHPLLGQVFADLRQIEFFATNIASPDPVPAAGPAIALGEAQALLAEAKIAISDLAPGDFSAARDLLRAALQTRCCPSLRMILHRIVAANVGPFVGVPVTAGPFAPGLNILSAPNETGKTTLLKAAGRALFDRHTCKADEIKSLRPAGTVLAPAITVEFETRAGRFRIEKTFLQGPRSLLSEHQGGDWKPVADADAADDRLNTLLQSTKPGRGATDAAHWGMLGYLWMRQGELAEWPEWRESPAGQTVQGMLVKVELDPFIEAVRQRMWVAFTENYTPSTNLPKAGGTLLLAEEELGRVETDLAAVAQTRREIQTDQDAYQRLADELPRLEAEHVACRQQADALREAAGQASIVKVEVDRCRHALETARDRRNAVQADHDVLRDHARQSELLAARLHAAQDEAARCVREAVAAQERLRLAETAQDATAQALSATLADLARTGKLTRHRRLAEEAVQGAQALERCVAQAATIDLLIAERAEIPTISPAKLTRLEKLQESIQTGHAKVEALGLTVELIPVATANVTVGTDGGAPEPLASLAAGETRAVRATQALTLDLPGWGTLRLRSGAGEARTVRVKLADDEAALRGELTALGVATLAEARTLAERARDLDRRLDAARRALADTIGGKEETADVLRARLAQSRRQLELLTGELQLTPEETSASSADLDAAEQAATVRGESHRAEGKTLEKRVKEHREAALQAAQAREHAERAVLGLCLEGENLQKQAATVRARHSGGVEAAWNLAGERFAEASYELKQATAKLPSDAETLPERNRRAAAAAEQVSMALQRSRAALAELRGRLEYQGASGLHGRESTLLVRREALLTQVTQARARSRAARLVHDLIERRKQAATRSVLAPLQERLGARFAEVSGERDRQIFLDESLVVRGLGRKDGDLVNFGELSQGAKEQLLLCLRLAIAEELAAGGGGPQSLILDDVLVNTDAARQERVLTLLNNAASQGLQILVCTCHPERYRGVGEIVTLRRGET